ncbi:MAG: hypothetical protein V3S89_15900 [Desulfobacterales bacterium]
MCPGTFRTQMWAYLADGGKLAGESKEEPWQRITKTTIPLGRPQASEDIGQLALYRVMADNVTGQAIDVDWGMELH